jgi:replicative superfamily II helicase
MVDFKKLRAKKAKVKAIDPMEIFRRLPKPPGINDLYTSQAQVLEAWFKRRTDRDVVIKLHTGGGKTLVGMLMGQSTINETGEPVLYLVPTVQLVNQILKKSQEYGISAVAYEAGGGRLLADEFVNGSAIMVGTYKALFNGRSKFGLRGTASPQSAGAVILDDAHVAFSVVRDSFTLEVSASAKRDRFESLCGLFRKAFKDADRLGTFDDTVSGKEFGVLEVPFWAWHEQMDAVREQIKSEAEEYALIWPLLRDRLHLCHALISKESFTITPLLPFVDSFPTFYDARRRIYMSATIADDSEIVRTFDADPDLVARSIGSRSLAGVSERMILIPDLMPFKFDVQAAVAKLLAWVSEHKFGSVVLVPSNKAAEVWSDIATVATGPNEVDGLVAQLQERESFGPAVFANRYDGIDLPGDSCRLLVMYGLPRGTSDYEIFRASALYGGSMITRMLAQRIEQGIGRGARGAGDHCVVMLAGADLAGWIAKDANFRFLTSATRAQLQMGSEVSKEVHDLKDLAQTVKRSLDRDQGWTEYHAETLAELVTDDTVDSARLAQAEAERKAINLWKDGYHDKAIAKIENLLEKSTNLDQQTRGWMRQLSARTADNWGNSELVLNCVN